MATNNAINNASTPLTAGNISITSNTISSTNAGGDIVLTPTTTGVVEVGANSTHASTLRWKEDTDNGVNFVSWSAAASLAGDTPYIWPTAYPAAAAGYFLTSDTSGNTSWATAGTTWTDQTTTPVTMVKNNAYSANNVGLVTLNVPASAAVGDEFTIQGQGAGGWLMRMNTGQIANLGSSPTTSAGSLASTNRYDAVKIVCTVANTTFNVMTAVGNLTVAQGF